MAKLPAMSYIAERRQEERDRRRNEIVAATEGLYASMGWDAITMDQVARQARVSRGLVYVYFRDKDDLHLALVERALECLRRRFEDAREPRVNGLEEVAAMGRAYLCFAQDLPHYFDACARYQRHHAEAGTPPENELACAEAGHRVHEVIVASINRGIADGSVSAELGDPYVTALTLWAFMHGVIQIATTKSSQIAHEGATVPSFIDSSIRLAVRAVRR